jgi:hypothetical protein
MEVLVMSRQEVYREIEKAFGIFPTFFKIVPHSLVFHAEPVKETS